MTEKPLAFLSLVTLLEEAVGHSTSYALLDPFPCEVIRDGQPSIVLIQNAGKIIANHVGLGHLTFVIAVTKQAANTAGHIELTHESSEVFVELSPNICDHKDAVLATLSHEIAHKFLHSHGLRNGTTSLEQEFLTDVTAVYLGMGKIMLNGCECQNIEWGGTTGRTKTTHTLTTGYISRECFAFVYRLVCEMRQIPRAEYLNGLSESARGVLLACEWTYREYFKTEYHDPAKVDDLFDDLEEEISKAQDQIATRSLILRWARREMDALTTLIGKSHFPLFEARARLAKSKVRSNNPHLNYLGLIQLRKSISGLVATSTTELGAESSRWKNFASLFTNCYELITSGQYEVVECPIDKIKLRVPLGKKRLLVTCSACKYRFIVNTDSNGRSSPSSARKHSKMFGGILGLIDRIRRN